MVGDRRAFLRMLGGAVAWSACKPNGNANAGADAASDWFPEKARDLILLTDRPPNLETPLKYFRNDLTPNEAFFVRWHLPVLPTSIDPRAFRLAVSGHVDRPLSLSLDDLKRMEPVSMVAVNQCSGNSRGRFEPHVPGVQWSVGALGNAKWTGVRLKDVLAKAGVKAGAVDVSFAGMDKPQLDATPAFVKSLGVDHANDGETMIAYAMNDAPLPMLNGFPLRLVVPGYYSTYWVKSLDRIEVLASAFEGYWMKKAYRIPKTPNADESPSELAKETTPIAKMNVRSLVVTPESDEAIKIGRACAIEGVAFDGGAGIKGVDVSTDGVHVA
jgi:DMSO/TMAO reductase YedYZ molybdopterin-dependent catalytic subunit